MQIIRRDSVQRGKPRCGAGIGSAWPAVGRGELRHTIEHSVSAADYGLLVYLVCQADSRVELMFCGANPTTAQTLVITGEGIDAAQVQSGFIREWVFGERIHHCLLVVALRGGAFNFPTQAYVNSEFGIYFVVILRIDCVVAAEMRRLMR